MVNGTPQYSLDAFVTLSAIQKNASVCFSYSYNSPQNVTFLPLPKLHVIGMQVIIGKRETAKAVVPYAQSLYDNFRRVTEPDIEYITASEITSTSAVSGGITTDNESKITKRGVCWSTQSNPTIADSHTEDGEGEGVFTSSLNDLTPNTTYYLRAYSINDRGISYTSVTSFTTKP